MKPKSKLTWRDAAATILVAAIVVPYAGYVARGSMPFIHNARAMAITALIIGVVACYTGDLSVMSVKWSVLTGVETAVGAMALAFGIGAAVTGNSGLLACFIVAIVGMWALATFRHTGLTSGHGSAGGTRTALKV
jgi:hypothetical protein